MLVIFMMGATILWWGVATILRMKPESAVGINPSPGSQTTEVQPAPDVSPVLNASNTVATTAQPTTSTIPTAPLPPPKEESNGSSPGMEAYAVLDHFLTATSLEERLPLIETKTPENELRATCLASPLPRADVVLEFKESDPVEDLVDYYFHVDFQLEPNGRNLQTILVRTRGNGQPKVVADPFLDLFGGRLESYASAPTDQGGVFQVIVYPVPNCVNPAVPNRAKKQTLKLLARNNHIITEAYFSRLSKIGEMLHDGSYTLSYGSEKACTVMLRWNTEEDPGHPYLEVIAIKALDWNP